MNDRKPLDLSEISTEPRVDKADVEASRTWQKTGYVPMSYVQNLLSQELSSGQAVTDLVRANMQNKSTT